MNAPVQFTLVANAGNAQHRQIASLLEQDLRALGIRLQIVPLEFRSLVDRILRTRDYDAAIMALAPGDADPGPEMSVWLSGGRSHFWNLNPTRLEPWEKEIDTLMNQQMATADQAARRRLYLRVQEIAQREMPLICLVSPHVLTAAKRSLRNVRRNTLPPYALANIEELYWEKRP
jgi:peptide/nickel transport system substrate-binding protein